MANLLEANWPLLGTGAHNDARGSHYAHTLLLHRN